MVKYKKIKNGKSLIRRQLIQNTGKTYVQVSGNLFQKWLLRANRGLANAYLREQLIVNISQI